MALLAGWLLVNPQFAVAVRTGCREARMAAPVCLVWHLTAAALPCSAACLQCTPDSLPSNILDQLGSWVAQNSTLLEGEPAAPAVAFLCAACIAASSTCAVGLVSSALLSTALLACHTCSAPHPCLPSRRRDTPRLRPDRAVGAAEQPGGGQPDRQLCGHGGAPGGWQPGWRAHVCAGSAGRPGGSGGLQQPPAGSAGSGWQRRGHAAGAGGACCGGMACCGCHCGPGKAQLLCLLVHGCAARLKC